jgi:hypothetical protein
MYQSSSQSTVRYVRTTHSRLRCSLPPNDYSYTGTSLKGLDPRLNRVDSVLLELPYDGWQSLSTCFISNRPVTNSCLSTSFFYSLLVLDNPMMQHTSLGTHLWSLLALRIDPDCITLRCRANIRTEHACGAKGEQRHCQPLFWPQDIF